MSQYPKQAVYNVTKNVTGGWGYSSHKVKSRRCTTRDLTLTFHVHKASGRQYYNASSQIEDISPSTYIKYPLLLSIC